MSPMFRARLGYVASCGAWGADLTVAGARPARLKRVMISNRYVTMGDAQK
jgi:hypothetical protein